MQKIFYYSLAVNAVLFAVTLGLFVQNRALRLALNEMVGARQQFGMIGIYNASAPTLDDGEGTALNTDSRGRVITSTSSQATLSN